MHATVSVNHSNSVKELGKIENVQRFAYLQSSLNALYAEHVGDG